MVRCAVSAIGTWFNTRLFRWYCSQNGGLGRGFAVAVYGIGWRFTEFSGTLRGVHEGIMVWENDVFCGSLGTWSVACRSVRQPTFLRSFVLGRRLAGNLCRQIYSLAKRLLESVFVSSSESPKFCLGSGSHCSRVVKYTFESVKRTPLRPSRK